MSWERDIEALITLLDDPDEEINKQVVNQLLSYGEEVVPFLEDYYIHCQHDVRIQLDNLIEQLQNKNITQSLQKWAEGGAANLFEGAYQVNKIGYPHLEEKELINKIDRIKLDAWIELHNTTSPFDQIKVLNRVIYDLHKFQEPGPMNSGPDHYFLNRVIDEKTGNPVSMGIVYCLIAQRLNIPVFGVNLPNYFILAYKELFNTPSTDKPFNRMDSLDPFTDGEVLFYINPYNQGNIFSKWNIDRFLKHLKISPRSEYYHPCSNLEIILRMLHNLAIVYNNAQNYSKMRYINNLIGSLQPYFK